MKLLRQPHFLLLCLLLLIRPLALSATSPVNAFTQHQHLKNANISLIVKDLRTGQTLHEHRSNHPTIPASTMKVITTATALELLGPDFTYQTQLSYDGTLQADGTLRGNLYIIGSGDPTLGSTKMGDIHFLQKWAEAVKKAGINRIVGSIVADDSRFDNEGANPKWTWDDIGNYYAPGIYAIAYRDNTLRVTFQSGAIGTTPEIIDLQPKVPGLTIDNNLRSSRITFDSAYFYGTPKSFSRGVHGEIPANKPGFVVRAELPNPALLLAQDFHAQLIQQGVTITGEPIDIPSPEMRFPLPGLQRTNIYTHQSLPLRDIIKEANEKSNNFYSEQIFKSLSLKNHSVATNRQSIQMVRNFWRSKGLDVSQLFQEDGSGLSPANAVSAAFLTDLMTYMHQKSIHKDIFFRSLAVAGRTGTLAGVLKDTPLSGKVYAKSGTISRVRAYTGYIIDPQRQWVFTVMVNNSGTNAWQTLNLIEKLLVDIAK